MVGVTITCCLAFCGLMKWLRNDRVLTALLVVTGVLAIIGIVSRVQENPRLNAWDGLISPFAFMTSFAFLRYAYKAIYRREPTYSYLTWYDLEERRHMNWFDLAVHLLPFLLALAVPVILTRLLG